jgi:hypothetical protein
MRGLAASAALAAALVATTLALAEDRVARGGGAPAGELPRGGSEVFPHYRVVGFYGAPQSPELGALGQGSPSHAARRLDRQARPYVRLSARPIYPAFELIAVIALAHPGGDGKYRGRQTDEVIRRYLRVARREELLMLLDIQPGRSTFIEEARHLRRYLRYRSVGLALDPEWNMGPHGVPGERIGHVGAHMVNRVSRLMNRIGRRNDLPQKVLVIHQFTEDMVRNEDEIEPRKRVAIVLNADGFGTPAAKRSKYGQLAPRHGPLFPGFKLFYEEDTNLMSPRQVLDLRPKPMFVIYE